MKKLVTVLSLCFCFGILIAQNDTIKFNGRALIYNAVDNNLLWYAKDGSPNILADEIVFSGSYKYYWNKYDSTLIIFGQDLGVGVGYFMPVTATFVKYNIQNDSIKEITRFYYLYSQYGLSPFRLKLSQSGDLQVSDKNGIVIERSVANLNYDDFKLLLDYLTK